MRAPLFDAAMTAARSPERREGRRTLRASVAATAALALTATLLPSIAGATGTTHAISGTVKNASAAGVPGISVSACVLADDKYGMDCSDAVTTGTDGAFSIAGLTPKAYILKLVDASHHYPNGYYATGGLALDTGAAATVTVADADITGIAVAYPAVFTMSGKVVASDGTPLASADVDPCLQDATGYCDLLTTTGAGGTFAIPVIAGDYTVGLYDHSFTTMRFFYQKYREGGATSGDLTVIHVEKDTTGLELKVQPASTISGHVTSVRQYVGVLGCASEGSPRCHGVVDNRSTSWNFQIAVVPTTVVVRVTGGPGDPTLPGFWSHDGIVAVQERATVLDLTSTNATGIDVSPAILKTAIHAGPATGGSFGTKPVIMKKGTSVTVKITLARGYAGAKVQVQAAVLDKKGKPGTFKTVATKTVGADGTVTWTAKPTKSTAYRARYVPPQVFIDSMGIPDVLSAPVIAKVK